MEIGSHVWLRSQSSQWGWIPAIISDKFTITNSTGVQVVRLTLRDDPMDAYTVRSATPRKPLFGGDEGGEDGDEVDLNFAAGISPVAHAGSAAKRPPLHPPPSATSSDGNVSVSIDPQSSSVWRKRGPSLGMGGQNTTALQIQSRLYTASFDPTDDEGPFEVQIDVDPEQLKTADHDDIKLRNLPSNNSSPTNMCVDDLVEDAADVPDDLIGLTHLHEPAILHALMVRYDQDVIYTATGPILIAVNPFKPMPLYSEGIMERYRLRGEALYGGGASPSKSKRSIPGTPATPPNTEKLPPHAYQTADDAYRAMMRGLENGALMMSSRSRSRKSISLDVSPGSQSILVSGESGAGKTVTTKIVLNYLAVLSRKQVELCGGSPQNSVRRPRRKDGGFRGGNTPKKGEDGENGDGETVVEEEDVTIEQQVLQSNPILEAFGNARTIRNDNSSRFGKYIDVHFAPNGKLTGAAIETYLLEKVRLIHPAAGERNYHVFYQLLSSATEGEREEFLLGDRNAGDFCLLNQSGTYDRRDGVSDEANHLEMLDAMITIGFSAETIQDLMRLAVAVLFLGNMTFTPRDHGEACTLNEDENSVAAASLLGVTYQRLSNALSTKTVLAGNECVHVPLNPTQAVKANEALIKAVYGSAFDFVVKRINESIRDDRNFDLAKAGGSVAMQRSGDAPAACIGVLDIFGFETFQVNSFEQICINYTNEALQQQFNKYVFKLEQQEYEREGIMWKFISFPDNQDVLDLIDRKHTGILALLDEQCIVPKGTDEKFTSYLYRKCNAHTRFSASSHQRPAFKFSIEHYAGPVEYSTDSWLEKNKDQMPAASMELLASSDFGLIPHIKGFVRTEERMGRGSVATKSVGAQFSSQLRTLRARIDTTTPHYIRCLKPNDDLVPHCFEPKNIVEQLRCGGVLEAVRVSRAGYPTRYPHEVFIARYFVLGPSNCNLRELIDQIALDVWEADYVMIQSLREAEKALKKSKRFSKDSNKNQKGLHGKHMFSPPRAQIAKALQKRQATYDGIVPPESRDEFSALDFSERCAVAGLQLGRTKVFLRREAFDRLEALRSVKLSGSVAIIQAMVRCRQGHFRYLRMKSASVKAQSCVRMLLSRRRVVSMVLGRAAVVIQSAWRMARAKYSLYSCYVHVRNAVCLIQTTYKKYRKLKYLSLYYAEQASKGDIGHMKQPDHDPAIDSNPSLAEAAPVPHSDRVLDKVKASKERESLLDIVPTQANRVRGPITPRNLTDTNGPKAIDPEVTTLKNELFRQLQEENWAMVEKLLDKNPGLAEEEEPSSGELPLHFIARYSGAWTLLIDTMLLLYPKALLHRDRMGALPIHHASAHDSVAALEIIYSAYKEGINDVDFKGRLPLHVAAEFDAVDSVKFLLEKSPEGAYTMVHRPPANSGGGLPLHIACRNFASIGVITALLAENFSSAKGADENGDLPLHLLLRCGEEVDQVAVKTLLTCFSAAVSRTDMNGDLPLAIALKHKCNPAVVNTVLLQFLDAARILDGEGHSPLFLALRHDADDRVILALLNHAPELADTKDKETGLLPIEVATEQGHSGMVVHSLLKHDLPIDLKEKIRSQLLPHNYSWNHIVSNTEDMYHQVVSKLLLQCTQPQVLALAHVEGPDGKIALASATPVCKHELRVMLRLFNTLEVVNQRPAYRNPVSNTQIFYALRFEPPAHQVSGAFTVLHEEKKDEATGDHLEDLDDASHDSGFTSRSVRSSISIRTQQTQQNVEEKLRLIRKEKGQPVIAKLTSRSDIVERELQVRKGHRLSRHYIPAVLSVHHTVQHAAYSEAMAEPGYCITMEGADTTAENMMLDLRKSRQPFPIKALKRIGISLLHMHEHGLIHGDFGTHNIGKFKNRWKLLGVGGAVAIGDYTDPNRGFYHPPESVEGESRRSSISRKSGSGGASVFSIKAQCTYDIWAFGVVVYEAIARVPLSPYARRGKRDGNSADLAKLSRWDENALKRALRHIDSQDVRAHDLLRTLLHPDPGQRAQSMRAVLGNAFFERHTDGRLSTSNIPQSSETSDIIAPSSSMPAKLSHHPTISTVSSLGRSNSNASSSQISYSTPQISRPHHRSTLSAPYYTDTKTDVRRVQSIDERAPSNNENFRNGEKGKEIAMAHSHSASRVMSYSEGRDETTPKTSRKSKFGLRNSFDLLSRRKQNKQTTFDL